MECSAPRRPPHESGSRGTLNAIEGDVLGFLEGELQKLVDEGYARVTQGARPFGQPGSVVG